MTFSAREQYFLELTNRARLDPAGEAVRFGIGLNDGIAGSGTITTEAKQVLAPNVLLRAAAEGHSAWMLATDTFSHAGDLGSNPGMRIEAAGYVLSGYWSWGENISFSGTTGAIDLSQAIVAQHEDLFLSPGHRENTLADFFREVGIAQVQGAFTTSGATYDTSMLTVNFASSGTSRFITGVAYDDLDGDDFYSIGEGRGNVLFQLAGTATSAFTYAAGGYALAVAPDAAVTVSITRGASTSVVMLPASAGNIKLDLQGDTRVLSSGDITLVSGSAVDAGLLGAGDLAAYGNDAVNRLDGNTGNNILQGGAGDDTLHGGSGDDTLDGGSGEDTAVFAGVVAEYTIGYDFVTQRFVVADSVAGRDGTDLVFNTEHFLFADGLFTARQLGAQDLAGTTEFLHGLYQNLYIRSADADGFNYWKALLDSGSLDRLEVVAAFAGSWEAQAFSKPAIGLYLAILGRVPDADGYEYWTQKLRDGIPVEEITLEFLNSQEFQSIVGGSIDNGKFVELLYQKFLERDPDAEGRAYWTQELANGAARTEAAKGFLDSEEFNARAGLNTQIVLTFLGENGRLPGDDEFLSLADTANGQNSATQTSEASQASDGLPAWLLESLSDSSAAATSQPTQWDLPTIVMATAETAAIELLGVHAEEFAAVA